MKTSILCLLIFGISFSYALDEPAEYVGSNKCKICHKKEKMGEQYQVWEAGPHASSFETLKGEEAIKIAKDMGITEAPDQAPACLICHVSGWDTPSGYKLKVDPLDKKAVKKNTDLARIGCEACHGAGSNYKSKKKMAAIRAGELKACDFGLDEIVAETCSGCHNSDSPTYKPFTFDERVKDIVHPIPDSPKE